MNMLGSIDKGLSPGSKIFLDLDRHRHGFAAPQIITPNVTSLFKNDRILAAGWELDVEILEISQLLQFFAREIN